MNKKEILKRFKEVIKNILYRTYRHYPLKEIMIHVYEKYINMFNDLDEFINQLDTILNNGISSLNELNPKLEDELITYLKQHEKEIKKYYDGENNKEYFEQYIENGEIVWEFFLNDMIDAITYIVIQKKLLLDKYNSSLYGFEEFLKTVAFKHIRYDNENVYWVLHQDVVINDMNDNEEGGNFLMNISLYKNKFIVYQSIYDKEIMMSFQNKFLNKTKSIIE